MEDNQGRHFVPTHGAWCWYKVAAILKSEGHKVTTLDMAASRINPKQVHEIQSFTDYVEPLMKFMESLPQEERVILVGHCMGGTYIALAMEKFPHKICVAVFAAALMPGPAFNYFTIKGRDVTLMWTQTIHTMRDLIKPLNLTFREQFPDRQFVPALSTGGFDACFVIGETSSPIE